jgi:lincosamide nucleotidyltransferase A/C/D/E
LRRYIVHPNVSDEPRDVYVYARTRPLSANMPAEAVVQIVTELGNRNLAVWIGGGWGIDALLGEQTREHADLDLACPADDEATVIPTLASIGYRVVLEYRPARVVLADDDRHEVDLHLVSFDAQGSGVQTGPHGEVFRYPPEAFVTASIAGQAVGCLSAQQRLRFHSLSSRASMTGKTWKDSSAP